MAEYTFLVKDFFLLKMYFIERSNQVFLLKIDILTLSTTEKLANIDLLEDPYQLIARALLRLVEHKLSHTQESEIRKLLNPFLRFDNIPSISQYILFGLAEHVKRGEIISYKDLAMKINLGKSYARVVGRAMSNNPYPLLYPCHRVVLSDGTLGKKFSVTGGVLIKNLLLCKEGIRLNERTLLHNMN